MNSGVHVRKIITLLAIISGLFGLTQFHPTTAQTVQTQFDISIVNKSNETLIPSPYSPGVWAVHNTADPLFTADSFDLGLGLEALAEAGNPSILADNLSTMSDILASGTFTQPIAPGERITFSIIADDPTAALSFASMFVASNDLFFAPDGMGIALFDENGTAISGEVTDQIALWDAGTEVNEAPGGGANQPLNGGAATGAAERAVSPFNASTRALPTTADIATFSVNDLGDGKYEITLTNISGTSGAIDTPISPLFYATHNDMWSLFEIGQPDTGAGLEALAEDGDPTVLLDTYTDVLLGSGTVLIPNEPNINQVSMVNTGIGTGQSHTFTVSASTAFPSLTVAAMVVQSNDAFLSPPPAGISLVDADGNPRPAADIEADLNRLVAVWDAGTEANETPGAGANQPLIGGENVGDPDPDSTVRLYQDSTNDLAVGTPYFDLDITPLDTTIDGTTFRIELTNTSGGTAYQGALSPLFAAQHNDQFRLFAEGLAAGTRLQNLAENGSTTSLVSLTAFEEVDTVSTADALIQPGESHVLTVTMSADFPKLSLASMIVPSNDAFVAFDSAGITLLDEGGEPLSQTEIDARIAESFIVWDAGTEANQVGAAGPDQAGAGQTAAGQGANEGSGMVRLLDDPIYSYPATSDLICVFITPQQIIIEPTDEPTRQATTETPLPPTFTPTPTPTSIIEPNPTDTAEPSTTTPATASPQPTETPTAISPTVEPTITPLPGESTDFIVTLINKSDNTSLPAPYSPGVWGVHTEPNPFFTAGTTSRAIGLEALAEAGNPAQLFNSLTYNSTLSSFGQINEPILPGQTVSFTVSAVPSSTLSLATMLVPSNDLFFAPSGDGISLFDENGDPVRGDVTNQITLWDAGTEVNEAPFSGPNQPLNGGAETGAAEGVVAPFTNSTRALPLASDIAQFAVELVDNTYVITLTNLISTSGAIQTPLSPLFFATHNDEWMLFEPGQPNDTVGLEALAEDGSATTLVDVASTDPNVDQAGSATKVGEIQQFTVSPTSDSPYLSVASMIVRSNDAFLAFPEGVRLVRTADGELRHPRAVERELNRSLAVWDAGTEANQTPGAGSDQPGNSAPLTGEPDPDNTVRRYADTTNDLAVGNDFFDLDILHIEGTTFRIQLSNTSLSNEAYRGLLSPVAIVQHNDNVELFEVGGVASEPLANLAENGDPSNMVLLSRLTEVGNVVTTEFPAQPSQAHVITATMSTAYPSLNIFSMIVPSNDAFVAFPPEGITLVNSDGTAISQAEIDTIIEESFIVWDAGTEANQAGAAGPGQAGAGQTVSNQGSGEGSGTVRPYENAVYTYPPISDLFCVLIEPIENGPSSVMLARTTVESTYVGWFVVGIVVLAILSMGINLHAHATHARREAR